MKVDPKGLGALVGAGALLLGGGTALAATGGPGAKASSCQARLAKVAERRGVSVAQLEADVKTRLLARVDRALAAGRITSEQAATLRDRISNAQPCSRPVRHAITHRVRHRLLRTAASYLDLTLEQLRTQLRGTSLGVVAVKNGKTVDGLVEALLAPAKARLAKGVSAGKLTQAQSDARLVKLEKRVQRLVAKSFPATS